MTPETLAANANLTLYSSMIVYTLAMLAFTWHLAARTTTLAANATQPGHVIAPARETALATAGKPAASPPVETSGCPTPAPRLSQSQ
ncbi:hypothetical protein [Terrabacter sp. NPDC000476]|uniref:hypothetical protein n=1 Tax=Terrabacter sp. NPDC000476 TaxID=3154258 RepID=UPI0033183234